MLSLIPDHLCIQIPQASSQAFLTLLLSIAISAFLGGFAHCAFMCGPFVSMQTAARLQKIGINDMSEFSRFKSALLASYHTGRIVTYTLLGIIVGYLGQIIGTSFRTASAWLMIIAASFFIASVLPLPFLKRISFCNSSSFLSKLTSKLQKTKRLSLNEHGFLLGLILGFLPCGMIYAALSLSAATESPLRGGLIMLTFGLATIPALVTVGLLSSIATNSLQKWVTPLTRTVNVFIGLWLAIIALKLIESH